MKMVDPVRPGSRSWTKSHVAGMNESEFDSHWTMTMPKQIGSKTRAVHTGKTRWTVKITIDIRVHQAARTRYHP